MKLDIKKEKEKLTTRYKKLWEFKEASIEEMYQEGMLNSEQKESMLQAQMALVRASDLEEQNEYNKKTDDAFAKRAIKKNEAEIRKMERFYEDNVKVVGKGKVNKIEKEIAERTNTKIQKYNEQNKNKGRKQ